MSYPLVTQLSLRVIPQAVKELFDELLAAVVVVCYQSIVSHPHVQLHKCLPGAKLVWQAQLACNSRTARTQPLHGMSAWWDVDGCGGDWRTIKPGAL